MTSEIIVPSEDSLASGDEGSGSGGASVQSDLPLEAPSSIATESRNLSISSSDLAPSDSFREITASNLHEYFWPPNSVTDRYFIQEQLAVFLDAKSFKQKYPDLIRRPIVTAEERNYLLQNGGVSQTQLNMGLTALRVDEVFDLMIADYAEKFEEYQKAAAERDKAALAVKQMELQAVKSDSKRLEEWRKKAIRSAAEWNSELNRDRVRERRYYLDMETMIIQEPARKRCRPVPADFGPYPAVLVPGQYQDFYKRYTTEQLHRLPVNGVVQVDDYLPVKRSRSPEAITVKPEELLQAECEENRRKAESELASSSKSKSLTPVSSTGRLSTEDGHAEEKGEMCAFCQEDILQNDRYIQCSKCGSCGHPACMDMTDELYEAVKAYNWMCMECKPCSICSKLDEEDKMLFCDRCDRGYHTFCVGLSELPSGRWVCTKYCCRSTQRSKMAHSAEGNAEQNKAAEAAVAAVIATPSTLKPRKVKSLDQTVEAVAQAVLSASSIDSMAWSPASTSSLSNSSQPPPESHNSKRRHSAGAVRSAPCTKCGEITAKGRRRIVLCAKCLLGQGKTAQKKEIKMEVAAGSDSEHTL